MVHYETNFVYNWQQDPLTYLWLIWSYSAFTGELWSRVLFENDIEMSKVGNTEERCVCLWNNRTDHCIFAGVVLQRCTVRLHWSTVRKISLRNKTIFLHLCLFHESAWNPSSWNTKNHLSYIINMMAFDNLATHGARTSWALGLS